MGSVEELGRNLRSIRKGTAPRAVLIVGGHLYIDCVGELVRAAVSDGVGISIEGTRSKLLTFGRYKKEFIEVAVGEINKYYHSGSTDKMPLKFTSIRYNFRFNSLKEFCDKKRLIYNHWVRANKFRDLDGYLGEYKKIPPFRIVEGPVVECFRF